MKRILDWRPSLLITFSLIGAFITTITGVAFAWNLQYQLEQNALRQEAESTAHQVILILSPNLDPKDLSDPLNSVRYPQVDELIHKNVLYEHIVRVKIWNTNGLVVYSDEKSLAGQYFPISDNLQKALHGEIATEVSTLDKSDNVSERGLYQRLLEVYVPIRLAGADDVVGVYEVYHDLAILDRVIADTRRFVWFSVGLGFLILYGSLFTLVQNASRDLDRRNKENKLLYEQEQTRRAELAALYDLSRALAEAHDFDTIFALVTRHAVETVRVTFSRMAILEGNELVIQDVYPIRLLTHNFKMGERYALDSHHFYQYILEQNTPIVISSDSPDLTEGEREALFVDIANTLCLIPLRVGNRAMGILILGEARSKEREPFSPDKIRLSTSIGDQAASALYRVELFIHLQKSYLETVLVLANTVDAKDAYTANHAQHVAKMALVIGAEMGMTDHELDGLRYGAILHDIGKIGVPDAILQKPSQLNPTEWAQMRQHPMIAARILAPIPYLASAAQIALHHHEHYNGKGYPDGLAGEAIPLGARILTVVDSYSAITDRRVYKEARSHAEALSELRKHAGTQFDSRVVDVFISKYHKIEDIP